MLKVVEEERVGGRSYFSFLPKDLTTIYLPLFWGYWIDSSRWLTGTFDLQRRTIPGIKDNNSDPIIQGDYLYCIRINPKGPKYNYPETFCLSTGEIQTIQLNSSTDVNFDCISTFLPNQSVVSGGCRHNLNAVLTRLTGPLGVLQQILLLNVAYTNLTFDAHGKIYIYKKETKELFCFSPEGELLWQQTYLVHLALSSFVVVQKFVFFIASEQLYRLNLSTQELIPYDLPTSDPDLKLYTDYHQYLVLTSDSSLFFLNLEGVCLRTITWDGVPLKDHRLTLHPNGDFYFLTRQSDEVTILRPS